MVVVSEESVRKPVTKQKSFSILFFQSLKQHFLFQVFFFCHQ